MANAEKDIVCMLLAAKINEINNFKKEIADDREAEKFALQMLLDAKTKEINNLKNEITNEQFACIHCKKTNHPSEQCFFRPGAKPAKSTVAKAPVACTFCKKTNHSAAQCHFNPNKVKA